MIEQHDDGMIRFTVTKPAAEKFHKDDPIDLVIEGQRVTGIVDDVKIGSNLAIVVVRHPAKPDV